MGLWRDDLVYCAPDGWGRISRSGGEPVRLGGNCRFFPAASEDGLFWLEPTSGKDMWSLQRVNPDDGSVATAFEGALGNPLGLTVGGGAAFVSVGGRSSIDVLGPEIRSSLPEGILRVSLSDGTVEHLVEGSAASVVATRTRLFWISWISPEENEIRTRLLP
jgi:hypothetical protein